MRTNALALSAITMVTHFSTHIVESLANLSTARRSRGALLSSPSRQFRPLSALRAHTEAPYKPDLLWESLRAINHPGRARTGRASPTRQSFSAAAAVTEMVCAEDCPLRAAVRLGFSRIVGSGIEAPDIVG
jgi:hypothetical protein